MTTKPDQKNRLKAKWYLGVPAVIAAILLAGPFALPLLWLSPCFTKAHKMIITVSLLALTVWLMSVSYEIFRILKDDMSELKSLLGK